MRANSPEFSGGFSTTIYKQKAFALRINDQIIELLNFYISSAIQI